MKEMIGGCCVCSDEQGWADNPLVYCDGKGCNVAVHQACYGIEFVPSGSWFCKKCEYKGDKLKVICKLCPNADGALKRADTKEWAHVICALYIPEVEFGDVKTMEPIVISKVPKERFNKICYICENKDSHNKIVGACMSCHKFDCPNDFHVTCGQRAGLLCEKRSSKPKEANIIKYTGFCSFHYKKEFKPSQFLSVPAYIPPTLKEIEGGYSSSSNNNHDFTYNSNIKLTKPHLYNYGSKTMAASKVVPPTTMFASKDVLERSLTLDKDNHSIIKSSETLKSDKNEFIKKYEKFFPTQVPLSSLNTSSSLSISPFVSTGMPHSLTLSSALARANNNVTSLSSILPTPSLSSNNVITVNTGFNSNGGLNQNNLSSALGIGTANTAALVSPNTTLLSLHGHHHHHHHHHHNQAAAAAVANEWSLSKFILTSTSSASSSAISGGGHLFATTGNVNNDGCRTAMDSTLTDSSSTAAAPADTFNNNHVLVKLGGTISTAPAAITLSPSLTSALGVINSKPLLKSGTDNNPPISTSYISRSNTSFSTASSQMYKKSTSLSTSTYSTNNNPEKNKDSGLVIKPGLGGNIKSADKSAVPRGDIKNIPNSSMTTTSKSLSTQLKTTTLNANKNNAKELPPGTINSPVKLGKTSLEDENPFTSLTSSSKSSSHKKKKEKFISGVPGSMPEPKKTSGKRPSLNFAADSDIVIAPAPSISKAETNLPSKTADSPKRATNMSTTTKHVIPEIKKDIGKVDLTTRIAAVSDAFKETIQSTTINNNTAETLPSLENVLEASTIDPGILSNFSSIPDDIDLEYLDTFMNSEPMKGLFDNLLPPQILTELNRYRALKMEYQRMQNQMKNITLEYSILKALYNSLL